MSIAAICCSHSPLMLGFYKPADHTAEAAVQAAFETLGDWTEKYAPELIVVFSPDHYNGFFYDLMPSFCIGVRAEGASDWNIQPEILKVPEAEALGCLGAVRAADMDLAVSWKMTVDHGTTIPLTYLARGLSRFPVIPIIVNCAAPPLPSFRRCRLLGEAVGRYLRSLDRRVLVIGSGGLSHDPPTPKLSELKPGEEAMLIDRRRLSSDDYDKRQSRVIRLTEAMLRGEGPCLPPNADWDLEVLNRLTSKDYEWFDHLDDTEIARVAGHGGHEVRCWVAALSAMSGAGEYTSKVDCYRNIPEWLTGMGLMQALPTAWRLQ